MYKIKLLDLKLLISLLLIPIILILGFKFGISGDDIYIYAEINIEIFTKNLLEMASPVFNIIRLILYNFGQGLNPIAYLYLGIFCTFFSYMLIVEDKKQAIVSWSFYLLTIQGFNTSFNLIRTSVSLITIALIFKLLNHIKDIKIRLNIALIIGILGHIQTILIFIIFNSKRVIYNFIKLIKTLSINKKNIIIIIFLIISVIFLFINYESTIFNYASRAFQRKNLEIYKVSFFFPLIFSWITYINLKEKNTQPESKDPLLNKSLVKDWIFVGWAGWILSILGFPLLFGRISNYALFFTVPSFTIRATFFEYIILLIALFLRLLLFLFKYQVL